MPFGIGHWEILVLALVVLLLFGSSQVPRIGRQLGRGIREAGREVAEVKQAFAAPEDEKPHQSESDT